MSLVLTAFLLSFLACSATALGSSIVFFLKKPAARFLALTQGLSAGVMIAISFIELLHKSIICIGFSNANLAFFAGIILIFLIDAAIPYLTKILL